MINVKKDFKKLQLKIIALEIKALETLENL